jgi:predicted metal-dependent phosphoesterase TrpH
MYKIDFHTHSTLSPDGGISKQQYKEILNSGVLDYVAVSDHNEIEIAQELQAELGDQIIVAEEIATQAGEIIGLYLKERVAGGLELDEAVKAVKLQGGLVYIPHPFEVFRKGINRKNLEQILPDIDVVEVFNARASFRQKHGQALGFALEHNLAMASSSDSHSIMGIGSGYSIINDKPTRDNLVALLRAGKLHKQNSALVTLLHPTLNRFKRRRKT